MIYAGIDEAGYGPPLGPFALGLSVFRVQATPGGESPDLFTELAPAVASLPTRGERRIVVADSKALYTSGTGLRRLEQALYSFHLARGGIVPSSLPEVLALLLHPGSSDPDRTPWYSDLAGAGSIPQHATLRDLEDPAQALRLVMAESGTSVLQLRVVLTTAADWNESLSRTQNKSVTAFHRVRRLLGELWHEHGDEGVLIHVDKQGGRSFYLPLLQEEFPALAVRAVHEGKESSCYHVEEGPRRMRIVFEPRAESRHLPVALASICAKYVRELMMEQFNAWFGSQAPGLRPTAGYPQDARRWLRDTAALRHELGIQDTSLVRQR